MTEFGRLIKPDAYQVFLFTCPATLPLSFAVHPWFVLNRRGIISRYGIGWRKADSTRVTPLFGGHFCTDCVGYLHKDGRPPMEGIGIFPFAANPVWKGKVIASIKGDEQSLAARMIDCIQNSPQSYPYGERYWLFGPNSNTYVEWVLDQFPESGMRLPWNAFGKSYRGSLN